MREQDVRKLLEDHPVIYPTDENGNKVLEKFEYGTAGFRYDADILPSVFVRMGMFAALRSDSRNGEDVGLMVTASHNPEADNGIKLADPNGGMLLASWEALAIEIANCVSAEETVLRLKSLAARHSQNTKGAMVHIGRDTRSHSSYLSGLAASGAASMGATVFDHGIVTTPQLHHMVMHSNGHMLPSLLTQRCGLTGYFDALSHSYISLLRTGPDVPQIKTSPRKIFVDCACGVGYSQIVALKVRVEGLAKEADCHDSITELCPYNAPEDGPLNHDCGAEFVQKNQRSPMTYSSHSVTSDMTRCCSLDGDADRIVFHYRDNDGKFRLLDGDKIAVLVALFIHDELRHLKEGDHDLRCGIVQTAYANGASTAFLRDEVKIDTRVAKTGVKFVHAAAHKYFDIGVYFEANGHGTVLFGPKFYSFLARADERIIEKQRNNLGVITREVIALQRLRALPSLVNQAVGDALSDLLLVEAILFLKGWDHAECFNKWDDLYHDMPSRQLKVAVKDRSIITTNENETQVLTPPMLQSSLNSLVEEMQSHDDSLKCRCFIRPSGTENVVRIYAEAATRSCADDLASKAATLVRKLCGGVSEDTAHIQSKL